MKNSGKNRQIKKTLNNSFHNTSVTIICPKSWKDCSEQEIWQFIQANAEPYRLKTMFGGRNADLEKYKRIKKKLCGMSDCQCGTVR